MAILVLFLTAGSEGAQLGKNFEEVVQLANKEGKVRIATGWEGPIVKAISDGFKKKHPKLSFEVNNVSGLDTRERILNEAIAGVVQDDLVSVSGELRTQYIQAGVMFGPLEWTKYFPDIDKTQISPDGYFAASGFSRYIIAYNPKQVPANQAPKTWEDCADPRWKGKVAVYVRPRTFTALYAGWGKEKSLAYHARLKSNEPIWVRSQTETLAQLAAGEFPIACGFGYHTILNILRRDPKANIKYVIPTELPIHIGEALAVMKGAKSPNAALLLAAYTLTDEGQDAYELYGRSSPFTKGSPAWKVLQETKAKPMWGGFEFEGAKEAQAAKEIIQAWGFPKGKK
jgi:iron(III) transport system substrate-binding protein